MFSQFKKLIRDFGDKLVMRNSDIPDEHKKEVIKEARKSIEAGIQKLKESGQLNQLAQIFKSNRIPDTDQSAVRRLSDNLVNTMSKKFNISGPTARTIAATLVMGVIGGLFATGVLMSNKANAASNLASTTTKESYRGKKGFGRRYLAQKGALEGSLRTIKHKHIRTSKTEHRGGEERRA